MNCDDENMIIFAARYAHSRNTGASLLVVSHIINKWDELSDNAKDTLNRESYKAQYCKEDWDKLRNKYESTLKNNLVK